MPVINITFDDKKVTNEEITLVAEATQKIVSEITKIEDVVVYVDCPKVQVKSWPIEIFVAMSAHKIPDLTALIGAIKDRIILWKKETGFIHPINLTVTPMPWKIEIGI